MIKVKWKLWYYGEENTDELTSAYRNKDAFLFAKNEIRQAVIAGAGSVTTDGADGSAEIYSLRNVRKVSCTIMTD